MTEAVGAEAAEGKQQAHKQKTSDIAWKVAAALLVAFLIYVLLHYMSKLVQLQGG